MALAKGVFGVSKGKRVEKKLFFRKAKEVHILHHTQTYVTDVVFKFFFFFSGEK